MGPYLEKTVAVPAGVYAVKVTLDKVVEKHKQVVHGSQAWLFVDTEVTCETIIDVMMSTLLDWV